MAYKRKTYDEYQVQANYGFGDGWECVVAESTFKEAKEQKKCYIENDPRDYRIVRKMIKIDQGE